MLSDGPRFFPVKVSAQKTFFTTFSRVALKTKEGLSHSFTAEIVNLNKSYKEASLVQILATVEIQYLKLMK